MLLVFGNLAILLWTILAAFAFWLTYPILTWIFLLLALAMVFILLRRLGCSSCYNCKSCTSGFGRLAGWFLGRRELKDLNNKTALTFVAIIYCLLVPIPVSFLAISVLQEFAVLKIIVLSCLLLISVYSAVTWLKPRRQTP